MSVAKERFTCFARRKRVWVQKGNVSQTNHLHYMAKTCVS